MPLRYPAFVNKQVRQAALNLPPMRQGARGGGVAILQAALIDSGYSMPVSTRKTGIPDGVYGREVKAKVIAFQDKQSLVKGGIAGRRTFNR